MGDIMVGWLFISEKVTETSSRIWAQNLGKRTAVTRDINFRNELRVLLLL